MAAGDLRTPNSHKHNNYSGYRTVYTDDSLDIKYNKQQNKTEHDMT
ncbi:hypothetical protein KGM_213202 [Danaus plexippus plexippus]|uniref:Uncharacterized protein n=1 Tax=Danaus plexippus plexippus TaxID=278856 RepID=A0A212FAW3_DANPL|nr:hypothetical protein KGM_213202 [Danaus plexippus plexippus]